MNIITATNLNWVVRNSALFVWNTFNNEYDFVHYADAEEVQQLQREAELCLA